jgi:glucosamine--fructose-6-phosphate aminotransferase (isomerizing)
MLKEIHEQPQVVTETFRGRIDQVRGEVLLPELALTPEQVKNIERITIVACGTAWHAALVTKFYLERYARIPVEVDYGSEFRYREPLVDEKTLFLVISQSGETIDTLGSLGLATDRGASTMAICNVGSSISRKAAKVLYTHAGPEMSVASTKAFVTQLVAGYLFALALGSARGHVSSEMLTHEFEELVRLPHHLSTALATEKQIEKIARKYGRSTDFLFLGRGILYPVALEGALKLKEISYLHAEGYPAGEMKHGPIALVNEETPVVVVLGRDGVNYDKTISNMTEIAARGGRVIVVCDEATPEVREIAWEVVSVGNMSTAILPMVLTVPLQLLAYHVAVYRGTDVDQPRNLAKSVTVE